MTESTTPRDGLPQPDEPQQPAMCRYVVTMELALVDGETLNPEKWNWAELLDLTPDEKVVWVTAYRAMLPK